MKRRPSVDPVLVLEWEGEYLGGFGPAPEQVGATAQLCRTRCVLLDLSGTRSADGGGLAWLLDLRDAMAEAGHEFGVVARRKTRLWDDVLVLDAEIELFESVGRARKAFLFDVGGEPRIFPQSGGKSRDER